MDVSFTIEVGDMTSVKVIKNYVRVPPIESNSKIEASKEWELVGDDESEVSRNGFSFQWS